MYAHLSLAPYINIHINQAIRRTKYIFGNENNIFNTPNEYLLYNNNNENTSSNCYSQTELKLRVQNINSKIFK